MNTITRSSTAERFGRWLGRGWREYVRRERGVAGWLVSRSVPAGVVTTLLWITKFAVLAVLLYTMFWLALLLVFLMFVARGYDPGDLTMPEAEWRDGYAGYGLYSSDGYRIDQHDPNDPHNT
ncbi:DUF3742 family protein [Pseudomonas nabeulensis]|uniref:DUF3742 family protein n=2 Tax=Pseudomonas TaxID=286 RepID=A0A7X1XB18_9PSED|nr:MULTISPECIES: DUF3742 family protein [Pseudomonas]MQT88063.1 DUF3742 family protein [Pseudomonas helleri]TFY92859.1 DUF3742 family protein [Pseudomonas nabeulensis]